jgi:AcrR family transcriptional regulator
MTRLGHSSPELPVNSMHLEQKGPFSSCTATVGLRERKKERLRQAILVTALQLFKERGYEQTRISDIASAVEIGDATLYRYFASKEAIVNGISAMAMQMPPEQLPDVRSDVGVEEHVRAVYGGGVAAQVLAHRWIFRLAGSMPPSSNLFGSDEDVASGLRRHLESAMLQGQTRGEITTEIDAVTLTDLLASMLNTTVLGWARSDGDAELQPRIEAVIRVFFRGVGK